MSQQSWFEMLSEFDPDTTGTCLPRAVDLITPNEVPGTMYEQFNEAYWRQQKLGKVPTKKINSLFHELGSSVGLNLRVRRIKTPKHFKELFSSTPQPLAVIGINRNDDASFVIQAIGPDKFVIRDSNSPTAPTARRSLEQLDKPFNGLRKPTRTYNVVVVTPKVKK